MRILLALLGAVLIMALAVPIMAADVSKGFSGEVGIGYEIDVNTMAQVDNSPVYSKFKIKKEFTDKSFVEITYKIEDITADKMFSKDSLHIYSGFKF